MMQSLTFFVLLKKAQALLLFSCVGNWYMLQINVDNISYEHIESEYLVCHESRCHFFFQAKHVYKQDTNSGALAGGIVSLAIVLLAVAIIILIYRR